MDKLKTINKRTLWGDQKSTEQKCVAIVRSKDWLRHPWEFYKPSDLVVVTFHEVYSDGKLVKTDNRNTIAICKRPVDADLIFYNYED